MTLLLRLGTGCLRGHRCRTTSFRSSRSTRERRRYPGYPGYLPTNQPGTIDGTNSYVIPRNMQDSYYNQIARSDHTISDNQRLFYGRFDVAKIVSAPWCQGRQTCGTAFGWPFKGRT